MDTNLIDDINIYWKRIFHSLKKSSGPILNELGLTKVDANILLTLSQEHEKTKAELAQYLSFEPNSLTRSLDRLVALNYVKRVADKTDRRFINLSLTSEGKRIAKQYIKKMRSIWGRALQGLQTHEVKEFEIILEKIFKNLCDED